MTTLLLHFKNSVPNVKLYKALMRISCCPQDQSQEEKKTPVKEMLMFREKIDSTYSGCEGGTRLPGVGKIRTVFGQSSG